ncbi:histidine protein methyltransferase 1 homolog isoform X1 [Colias croceus]|uniref:histidine protein methyltransferase 1 homolog isoform X1 n=2 Tax=Colias crocea TaxID=72248 RepID=UPI001E27C975|nr:histidine protein methyltransferase 1 homolog isoform X1 [Colias croceus]
MASFKFNFNGVSETEQIKSTDNAEINIEWLKSEKIEVADQVENLETIAKHAKMFMCGDVEIGHIVTNELQINNGTDNAVELAEKEHSDLITGKYEGGLKIWECTYDLIEYLEENNICLENKKVVDLGCGSGILGIYAFQKHASVTFQDYNKEIIEHVTIPNVILNIEDEENRKNEIQKCQFYSGDWQSFNEILAENEKYDIILTSETIYNLSNYDKLVNFFNQRLTNDGTVYIAAKTYYFGVGGGMRQFEQALTNSGKFKFEIVWNTTSGIQREIMKITRL